MKSKNFNPLITIYITNHNYGKYLSKSINSVLKQTYSNYELIIIDDGSTDNSKNIIKKYQNLKNIKIIFQKNKGLLVSNNIALKLSNGDYITRLDADDWLDENFIKNPNKEINNICKFLNLKKTIKTKEIIKTVRKI